MLKTKDGRGKKSLIEQWGLSHVVAQWWQWQQEALAANRCPSHELWNLLTVEHGYRGSYKSVRKYVRKHFPKPPLRPFRRVETSAAPAVIVSCPGLP